MKHYPLWKIVLVFAAIALGFIYASPNLYRDQPAIQLKPISEQDSLNLAEGNKQQQIETLLNNQRIAFEKITVGEDRLIAIFPDATNQAQAKAVFEAELSSQYYTALTLAPNSPDWLQSLGLKPINKGLDLRGGVSLLLQVDTSLLIDRMSDTNLQDIKAMLDDASIAYNTLNRQPNGAIDIALVNADDRANLQNLLFEKRPDLLVTPDLQNPSKLIAGISDAELERRKQIAVEQNTVTLRTRMNSIGVAEPSVTRQGSDRIVVELPGLSDPNDAIALIQSTATLEYYMVDEESTSSGRGRFGVKFLYDENNQRIALDRRLIISGDNIIDASSSYDQQQGQHIVSVVLDEAGASKMGENTQRNVGNRMAVVFIEYKPVQEKAENGDTVTTLLKEEKVISAATIQGQFSKRFQTTGNFTATEARNLARSLRSGALAAPVYVIEERTIGPSAGEQNIRQGTLAIILGFVLVMIFMGLYYKKFGLVAITALLLNVIFIIALLSFIGATLTLPGIAGVVLTMGMAVDANVLIFERIKEELRLNKSPKEAIQSGFDNAFSTIMDANITTLIAAAILFAFGTGPIKGFAVTLSIGILTSMFTAIVVSRFIIHYWLDKKKQINALSI